MTNKERKEQEELLEWSGHVDVDNSYSNQYLMRQSVAFLRQIKDMSHYTGDIKLITPFGLQTLQDISYFTAELSMAALGDDNTFYVSAIPKKGSLAEQEANNTYGRFPVCKTTHLLDTYIDEDLANNGLGEYQVKTYMDRAIATAAELNKFLYMGIPVVDVTMWEGYGLLFTGVSADAASDYLQYLRMEYDE